MTENDVMSECELNMKLSEYSKRNNFWTEKAINQLGYSINLFTTVGIALLGYLIKNISTFPKIEFIMFAPIAPKGLFLFLSILFIFFSLILGFSSVLSRLMDFRITRHLSLTRKRFLNQYKNRTGLIKNKIVDISRDENKLIVFYNHIIGKIDLIVKNDFENGNIKSKFETLRNESTILGELSWKFHKCQIMCFIIGLFLLTFLIF